MPRARPRGQGRWGPRVRSGRRHFGCHLSNGRGVVEEGCGGGGAVPPQGRSQPRPRARPTLAAASGPSPEHTSARTAAVATYLSVATGAAARAARSPSVRVCPLPNSRWRQNPLAPPPLPGRGDAMRGRQLIGRHRRRTARPRRTRRHRHLRRGAATASDSPAEVGVARAPSAAGRPPHPTSTPTHAPNPSTEGAQVRRPRPRAAPENSMGGAVAPATTAGPPVPTRSASPPATNGARARRRGRRG